MTGIARQYALAVFSLAKERKREVEFKQLLDDFSHAVDEAIQKFFSHPKIAKTDKQAMLTSIVKDPLLLNYLKVLIDNDRFELLEATVYAYQDLLDEQNKVMQAVVYTNHQMTKANLNKIKVKLEKTYHSNFDIDVVIDKTIIGGFRIEFEGNVIDESINKQLENIKSSLSE